MKGALAGPLGAYARSLAARRSSPIGPEPPKPATGPVACPRCHDAGWVRSDVPLGDPLFGVPVRCVCQKAADEARRFAQLRALSDFAGEDVAGYTFAGYDSRFNGEARAAFERWAANPEESPRWLMVWGAMGTGKSHLLRAAWNVLVAGGRSPVYAVAPTLLRYVREGIATGQYGARFEAVRTAPVLLLDDLGAEKRTDWTDEAWFELLNWRYQERLPTAVASNCAPDDLEGRIASRLQDARLSAVYAMKGPDYRRAVRKSVV